MEAITSKRMQDVDLSESVLKTPMDKGRLITALRSALEKRFPAKDRYASTGNPSHNSSRIRHNDCADSLKMFEHFLSGASPSQIGIDENLFGKFAHYVETEKGHWGKEARKVIVTRVRTLINDLPDHLRNRRLLSPSEHKRTTRFDWCSPETQAAIRQFLADGRSIKKHGNDKPTLTGRLLSASFRTALVGHLAAFLKAVGKTNVYEIGQTDVDKYLDIYTKAGKRDTGVNNLASMQPFFNNLWAAGLIDRLPFNAIYEKKSAVDDDFVPPEGLAVLRDLSTIDMKDMVDVRDRLVAVCLCYDFALRVGEVARLKVSDVEIRDYVELTIRSEIQKGHRKPTKLDYAYFAESKTLMTQYLKLREAKSPATDALIVTEKGGPMYEDGCRNAVQELCKKLGVKTFKGEVPAPHRFRHSFGTCNVTPLGLGLDIYDIMKRLRHTSIELTTRTYISDNPLLTKAKHDAHVQGAAMAMAVRRAGVSAGPSSRQIMTTQHQSIASAIRANTSLPLADSEDLSVAEYDALKILAPFNLIRMSLQKYAKDKGMAEKRKGEWFYSRQLIDDLSQNYFTKQEAMKIIGFAKSAFFYWISSRGIQQVVIGKVSLVRKDDVLAKSRGGDFRKSA